MLLFIFEREREGERESASRGRDREKRRHRIQRQLPGSELAVGTEPEVRLKLMNFEIMT